MERVNWTFAVQILASEAEHGMGVLRSQVEQHLRLALDTAQVVLFSLLFVGQRQGLKAESISSDS